MESEEKIIVAFLFKRSGKKELKDSELYLPLSLELSWFSSKEAQVFVKQIVEKKLVIKKEGLLTPSFDIENVEIPVGFFPTKKDSTQQKTITREQNIFDIIVGRISKKIQEEPEKIIQKISTVEQEKHILREVAALLVAKKYDVMIDDCFEKVKEKII